MRWKLVTWLTIQATELSGFLLRNRAWRYDLSDYEKMPGNTLGGQYYLYLKRHQITFKANLVKHDMKHIILGYEMKMPGELDIVAFLIGNKSFNKTGVVYLFICLLIVPEYLPKLRYHYRRGKQAHCLRDYDLSQLVEVDLNTIRKNLNII